MFNIEPKTEEKTYQTGLGIRGKIVLLVSLLVILTAASTTLWIFNKFNNELIRSKTADIVAETELVAFEFKKQIEELLRDINFLDGTPPIQGIIRAYSNNGIDPFDGSSSQIWHDRLATIFSELLKAKPEYVQVRYIGIENKGKEIVRVDRYGPGNSIRIVPEELLQNKEHREYFKDAMNTPVGNVYLSEVELNREYGKIIEPPEPIIRVAMPVYKKEGEVFGFIIINYSISSSFKKLKKLMDPNHEYYITNNSGDYLLHPDPGKTFGFEYGKRFNVEDDFPLLMHTLTKENDTVAGNISPEEREKDRVAIMRTLNYNPYAPEQKIGVVAKVSFTDITAISKKVLQQASFIILLLVLFALVVGIWVAQKISKPIMQIAKATRSYVTGDQQAFLPVEAEGEAGVLARVFKDSFGQLIKKEEELLRSNKDLEQFAYVTSHDLQEPLRTITSYTQLLERRYADKLDGKALEFMGFIVDAAKRMQVLINDLLKFSRLNNEMDLNQQVDMNEVWKLVYEDLKTIITETNAIVTRDELPLIKANETPMRQLLQNLIGNSLKYRSNDRTPEIHVSVKDNAKEWVFSVEDNGIGIEEKFRKKVFVIFQRLHGRHEYTGTGIGLALCKKIVEQLGGTIWIGEKDNSGSLFYFSIPKNGAITFNKLSGMTC